MDSHTEQFARYFANLSLTSVPKNVQDTAVLLILDTLGCAASALHTQPAQSINELSTLFGGKVGALQLGRTNATGVMQAAYANTRLSNLMDFDETYPVGVHFGNAAVMAAIAAAQAYQRDSRDMLTGVIAGYEAGARMASAIGPMMHVKDGVVTGFSQVWGVAAPVVIAACIAYGTTIGITDKDMHQAIGISGSNIPLPIGNKWSSATDLPYVKYCDAGWCATTGMHGVHSALLGLTGFENILDGPVGIVQAYSASMPDDHALLESLGGRWHLEDITFKPWPSCRFMHAPLTALERILAKNDIDPTEIIAIQIQTGPLANSSRFHNPRPKTFCSYQFSYPHAAAMMVLGVPPGPQWFDPEITEQPLALELRDKTEIVLHPNGDNFVGDMTNNQIRAMPGGAVIKTKEKSWEASSDYAYGDPWDSSTQYREAEVVDKFLALYKNRGTAESLIAWLNNAHLSQSLEPLDKFFKDA